MNSRMLRAILYTLVAAAAAQRLNAAEEMPDLRAHWYCWYAPPSTISCLLESAPASLDATGVDLETLRRLPPGVTELRLNPDRFRGEQIDTPLLGSPTDLRLVEVLARSVMCGSQQRCAVSFSQRADPARIAGILRAATLRTED